MAGLQRFDPSTGQFTTYRNSPGAAGSLSNDQVNAICIDPSGILWIGTQTGLDRFDPVTQTFTVYYERDGLPSDRVTGILEDERGNVWLSTSNGLSRFDPRAKTFANYSASDGIVRGNFYGPHAGWKSSSDEMFFASSAGVVAFFPEKVVDNAYTPPVVLTDFQSFGKAGAHWWRFPAETAHLRHQFYYSIPHAERVVYRVFGAQLSQPGAEPLSLQTRRTGDRME